MKTGLRSQLCERRLFKVRANHCNLRVGDQVSAETRVGQAFASGETLQAGCKGLVEAVNLSADEDARFVWVRMT